MAVEVGSAYVSILPSFRDFGAMLRRGVTAEAAPAGEAAGALLGSGVTRGADGGLRNMQGRFVSGMGGAGTKAGQAAASGLTGQFKLLGGALAALGAGAFFYSAVKGAGDFQASMVKLTETAGETGTMTSGNLKVVSDGILKLAGDTATSTKHLSDGMYLVESAGFHGASGLKVLQAAAEGARAEQADLPEVTNAVTSALMSYHMSADQSMQITNQMIAAVGHGKMTFQDFAGSLSTVLPVASAAGLSFAEVAGAEATLTNHGTSAHEATQELANTIRSLQAPNAVAVKEMERLGLSSTDVAQHLGERGLTGTLDMLVKAIGQHMGPEGLVLIDTFNKSKSAAADAKQMLDAMPPAVHKVAEGFLAGKTTITEYQAGIKGLPADQAAMARQFATLVTKTSGFNDLLKKGSPAAQTFTDAVKKMTGGATGMNTTLMLTGENFGAFQANVAAVAGAADGAGQHIKGWENIQKTFNFQMDAFKQRASAAKTAIGLGLLPAITSLLGGVTRLITPLLQWMSAHKEITTSILGIVGGVSILVGLVLGAVKAVGALTKVMEVLRIVTIAENGAMAANPFGLVVLAIVALVAALVYAFNHWKAFHNLVITVWNGIKVAALAAWNNVLKPTFTAIGVAAMWLWNNAIKPAFNFIMAHWRLLLLIFMPGVGIIVNIVMLIASHWNWLWNSVLKPTWNALVAAWRFVVNAVMTLWNSILLPAWRGIAAAGLWLWNSVLKPTWNAMVTGWRLFTAGVATIWNSVLAPVFRAVAAVVGWLWNNIFRPTFTLIWGFIKLVFLAISLVWRDVLWPVFQIIGAIVWWLWDTIFKVVFALIKLGWSLFVAGLKLAWDTIGKPLFDAIGAVAMWLWRNVFVPAWAGIKAEWNLLVAVLKWTWDNVLHPVFEGIGAVAMWLWRNVLVPAWAGIKIEWNLLVAALKWTWDNVLHPVFDMVAAVVHDVASKVGAAFDGIAGFFSRAFGEAKNAIITGWNDIARWVNDNVIRKVNDLFHISISALPTVSVINNAPGSGGGAGPQHGLARFAADGGYIRGPGTSTSDSIPAMLSDGEFVINARAVRAIGLDTLNQLNAAGQLVNVGPGGDAGGARMRLPGFADGGQVEATKAWIRQQAGKPYNMGGVGPGSIDCSGLVGDVWALLNGKPPYRRYFDTSTEGEGFFKPGFGDPHGLNVGWVGGSGGAGHTVGVLDGLYFEATPPRVLVGNTFMRPQDSYFAHKGHLDAGGTQTTWGWLYDHTIGDVRNSIHDSLAGLSAHLPQLGFMTDVLRGVVEKATGALSFDNGGLLPAGDWFVHHRGSEPDRVLNASQWDVAERALNGASTKTPPVINIYPRAEHSETEIAAAVSREWAWAMR